MNLPPSAQRKVDSLKRMTVANGATESEAQSATRMIEQIYQRYQLTYTQSYDTINHTTQQKATTKFDMSKYYTAASNGTLENNVTEFDWDEIAKTVLSVYDFMEYVTQTAVAWEQWMNGRYGMKTPNNVRLTQEDYKRKCYRTFMKIKEASK
jgi:hypothetical protein